VTVTVTGESSGVTQNNSSYYMSDFTNINNLAAAGQGTIIIAAANKVNTLHITGALQGYINDPMTFSGFNTIVSPYHNTELFIDTAETSLISVINSTLGTLQLNNSTLNLINFFTPAAPATLAPASIIPQGAVAAPSLTPINNDISGIISGNSAAMTSFNMSTANIPTIDMSMGCVGTDSNNNCVAAPVIDNNNYSQNMLTITNVVANNFNLLYLNQNHDKDKK
jgi:hypothetical protein